jgi:acetyl esterase/lipase
MGTDRLRMRIGAVVTTLALAACSGGDTGSTPGSPPPLNSEPTTAPPDGEPTTTSDTIPELLQLAVEPAIGLVDGQIVTVTGRGLRPADIVVIGECADTAPPTLDDCEPAVAIRPEGRFSMADDGTLATNFRVYARFTTRAGNAIDCRDPQTDCLIAVSSAFSEDPLAGTTLPVTFDPLGELAEPGVSITVDDDLVDGQTIGVSVWGLPPGTPVAIGQCTTLSSEPEACETEIDVFAPRLSADATGRVDTTVWAQIEFDGYERTEPISCRPPTQCHLDIAIEPDGVWEHPRRWALPLTFDPTAPLAEAPEISVTPSTGLIDRQTVDLVVPDVLATRPSLVIVQCSGAIAPEHCDLRTAVHVPAPSTPDAIAFVVRTLMTTGTGDEIDCRRSDADCSIGVTGDLSAPVRRWGVATIEFDEGAGLAPPPTVRIIEGGQFEERTYVTVTGTGFPPDGEVQVAQCSVGSFHLQACSAVGIVIDHADARGSVERSYPMLLTAGAGDCSRADQCEVRVVPGPGLIPGFDERTSAAAPVRVTPPVGSVRYEDRVFDDVEIRPGIVYGRGVDGDGAPIDLTLDVYLPAGDTDDDRPVIIWSRENASEFASRGFVVVTTHLDVSPTRESIQLGYENTLPLFDWLAEHADELRIDPGRIAAAGQSRGGFIATSLAYAPSSADGESPLIAAAVSLAGGSVPDLIESGEPPSLMIHGELDGRVPLPLAEQTCAAAAARGVGCTLVVYPGRAHEVGLWNDLIFDIWDRVARFLVDELELE